MTPDSLRIRVALGALTIALGTLAVALGCGPPQRPGAVLISVDTLRADHVGAIGGGPGTPAMDALAREGTVFEHAVSPLPLTRPAHFSMLTGQHPRAHGVLDNSTPLPAEARTLPEILRDAGWRTAAFTATRILGPDSGAPQGFEHFEATGRRLERPGDEVVERALGWLETLPPEAPFFLWVHLYEPHIPYAPPGTGAYAPRGAGADAGADAPARLDWPRIRRAARANGGDVPAALVDQGRRLYRAEVDAADAIVGRLLAGLAQRTALDRLLLLLTADHGECFEKGFWFEHSDCLYDGALRVPLIVRQPGAFPAGHRVTRPVSLLDVAPTVLRAAGLEIPREAAGHPLQQAETLEPRTLLVQHPFYSTTTEQERRKRGSPIRSYAGEPARGTEGASGWAGVVGPRWKLLVQDVGDELYPTGALADVDESASRAAAEPDALAAMHRALAEAMHATPLRPAAREQLSPDLREALEALGYVE